MSIYEDMGVHVSDKSGLSEFSTLPTLSVLAHTIYSEVRGESDDGKTAVAYIAQNRVNKNLTEFGGNSMINVLLKVPGGFDGL